MMESCDKLSDQTQLRGYKLRLKMIQTDLTTCDTLTLDTFYPSLSPYGRDKHKSYKRSNVNDLAQPHFNWSEVSDLIRVLRNIVLHMTAGNEDDIIGKEVTW